MKRHTRKAFTLIELLVVVAIIALLLSILLPSLAGAREQGKKAKCLANLANLGKSMYQYANEDSADQIIPIHENMVKTCPYWQWRTVNWFAWGGRDSQIPFMYAFTGWFLSDDPNALNGDAQLAPVYSAKRRPLNRYMLGEVQQADLKKLEWFMCPSDQGYPDDPRIDDSPSYNALRSCYDTMGNSYRGSLNMYGLMAQQGAGPSGGHFSVGPWGHRNSTLLDTGKLVLIGEPTFFNMIGQDTEDIVGEVPVYGWHKKKLMDNLLFCDGSARTTKAEKESVIDESGGMGDQIDPDSRLFRGTTFRLDTFPVGGAIIWGNWSTWLNGPMGTRWPWRGFQDNLRK